MSLMKKTKEYVNHPLIKKDTVVRREYQEKIFAECIDKNSMVVLPTAMGKTIVALLLTVYHLSEEIDKKIIFLAPTKPLVVQHQSSFLNMTIFQDWELPVMTGSTSPEKREKLFLDAKIAFMTPQVLQNDIISNKIDLNEVSMIIFDEAHRAVGDYAYTFIAEVYTQRNPNGQILAMSASPGGDKEKIEEVCKNLKVQNVEIRTHESKDVKPYVHNTDVNWIEIHLPDEYITIKKELENLLKEYYKQLKNNNFIDSSDVGKITRKDLLSVTKKIDFQIRQQKSDEKLPMLFAMKKIVSNAIRVSHMLELLEAQGIEPLNEYFLKNAEEVRSPKASKSLKELYLTDQTRNAVKLTKKLIESKFIHPKLVKLGGLLHDQFQNNLESRVLVFANFRDSINSILKHLEKYPEMRPQRFVGQQNRKKEKGMSQKEQIAVLEDFKSGKFNVLIATSVAEEGLDIAECDLVIFYDVVPSEIRTIQRRGRTGRKSAGSIYILMTKGTREEGYYWAEKKRERVMKKSLKDMKQMDLSFLQNQDEESSKSNKKQIDSISDDKQGNLMDFMQTQKSESERKKLENKEDNKEQTLDLSVSVGKKLENLKQNEESDEKFVSAEELGGESKGFTVIVDNRETQSAVVRHLALMGVDLILKNLSAGDYVLSENVGIERKEALDFNRSIMDGRIFDELHRLSQNFSIPILIVEGNPVGATNISKNAIMGALASIVIKMRINIMYTESQQETAELIVAMTKKVQEQKDSRGKIYKKKTGNLAESQEQIIGSIPGVNLLRAQSLLSTFSNIKNIFNADEDILKKVSGIGPTTAKKIKEISEHDYNENK